MLIEEMYNLTSYYDVWLYVIWKEMETNSKCLIAMASKTKPSLPNVADRPQLSDVGTHVLSLIPRPVRSIHFFIPSYFLINASLNSQKLAKVSALMNTKIEVMSFQSLLHLER